MRLTRFVTLSAIAFGFLTAGWARADLDREDKEKKDEKAAKAEMGDDEHEAYHKRLLEEGEKNLEEINKLLDEVQKNLGQKDTGSNTQVRQKEIVDRIEKLIKELDKG